ncbi:MAG TPA: putative ABC exporter domain-containing protein [Candidatus Didemnitutus sp.]|nr:putative ABC exporter domain-containing protein [Candidatus Didemnitutus sp.]
MTRAFLFLYFTSMRNALVQRLQRLRQPKYLVGAIVGILYFYLVVFRRSFRGLSQAPAGPPTAGALIEPIATVILFIVVALSWLFSNRRAALQFSEAEVAFLFPAPVSRRTLINYRLIRSQVGIFLSAFFLGLVLRQGMTHGAGAFMRTAGWWVILSTLNLHFLAASFARDRLLDLGVNPVRRRLIVGALLVAFGALVWWVLRNVVSLPTEADAANLTSMGRYVSRVLATAPISWVLRPFDWVVRPYFAATGTDFLTALPAALLLMAGHYLWAVQSSVSFEEASIDAAARRAERIAAARSGRWTASRKGPTKPKSEPFRLSPRGWPAVGFLWKNLIALGPLFRLRVWVIAAAVAVFALNRLAADPGRMPLVKTIGWVDVMLACWFFIFGPMFMRREVQQTLSQLDMTKAFPLAGWQIVVGQLLTPIVLMTFVEWFFLLVATLTIGVGSSNPWVTVALGTAGAAGLVLILPPLCGLLLCIPYAGVLYFPAWAQSSGPRGGGVEIMGQRLIFLAGYVVVLAVAILPAAAVGGLAYFIVSQLVGTGSAVVVTTLCASVILCLEVTAAVWWLGQKVDQFDLSTELPR